MFGRKLDVIGRRRIERAIAADADDGAAVLQDDVGGFGTRPRRFFDGRRFVGRDAVDLRGVKHGVVFQDADRLPAVLGFVVFDLIGLREKDRGGFLALADLPVLFLRLLVGHPARIAALEGAHVHAENEDIDAVIALAGDGIEGRLRAAGLLRVPRANPGLHAVLKLGDDAVREFLHRIAGGADVARARACCVALGFVMMCLFRLSDPHGGGERGHVLPPIRARRS
jgi:hypothetical protein